MKLIGEVGGLPGYTHAGLLRAQPADRLHHKHYAVKVAIVH